MLDACPSLCLKPPPRAVDSIQVKAGCAGSCVRLAMPRAGLVAAMAAVLMCCSSASTASARAPSDFWGVAYGGQAFQERDLQRMHGARIAEVRWTIFWPAVQS